MNKQPSKFFTKLFKRFCNDAFYEELQGDLEERFYLNLENTGANRAKAAYRKEVIKMIRPSVLKSMKTSKIFRLSLFKIHWTLSIRSLKRNKVFSLVTTLGFAAAISISLFLINLIYSGYSVDQQHESLDRIHRIATRAVDNGETKVFASTPFNLKERVVEEVPGFELITHINRTLSISFERNDYPINLNGIYVDENFFKVFNFSIISGNAFDIFKDVNSIIITQEYAKRLFKGQNPIGQMTNGGQVVRAVIESPKNKSHIQFEAIGNIGALDISLQNWDYKARNYLYGRISENVNRKVLDARLTSLSNSIKKEREQGQVNNDFFLQPITALIFKDGVFNEIGSSVGREGLIIFSSLTILLVAMACFNYTNLSLARALQRTKEVGIRKVAGSTPVQIISQFLIETFLFSSLGFLIGLGVYVYYSGQIANLIPFPFLEISDYQIILVFAGFAIITSLIAGIFPALFFSRISPLSLFNKQSSNGRLSLKGLRKLLVGSQVTVSMFCVILLSLVIDQNKSLRNAPTGIQSDQLLIVNSTPETASILIREFEKIPGVSSGTVVSSTPVVDFPSSLSVIKKGMPDSLSTRFIKADENFDNVFQPKLRLGRFFEPQMGEQAYRDIIVSHALLQKMEISENEALGTVLNGKTLDYRIVGVLQQTISANPLIKQNESFMLISSSPQMDYGRLVLKLEGKNLDNTLNQIQAVWEGVFTRGNFQASFFDTELESTYNIMITGIRIITFIGSCIILISILGQLGMALFNAQSRVKEIGIRKVMGAAISSITRLILKSTTNTIALAAIIATPAAYFAFVNVVAPEVRTPLTVTPWLLLKGVLVLTILILGVVISQTWRVATLNPTKSLRNE